MESEDSEVESVFALNTKITRMFADLALNSEHGLGLLSHSPTGTRLTLNNNIISITFEGDGDNDI